jgi:hypothetical protein
LSLILALLPAGQAGAEAPPAAAPLPKPVRERLLPAPKNGGFQMKDYFVWCGALIEAEGKCHLFASRWPKATGFPEGYRKHSVIVRAVADRPEGPFAFAEVALGPGDQGRWDGQALHNPKIIRYGGQYVLFLAEQAIRFVVIDRRITQGTRSETGRRWCERIWTVIATCAQQGRSVFEFLLDSVHAHFGGGSPPSLLPSGP